MRSFSDQNEQLCQKIEAMEADRAQMTRKLNQLNYENAELKEKLEESVKYADSDELKKLQDETYESKRKLADVLTQLEEVEKKLQEKTSAHEKSLQVIKKACEHIEDLELHVERLKSSQPNSLSSTESARNVRKIYSIEIMFLTLINLILGRSFHSSKQRDLKTSKSNHTNHN